MPTHPVRSGRIVVVGDGPVARGLGTWLGVEVCTGQSGPARFAGADAVVLVGYTGDFAAVRARHAAERREELASTAAVDLVDAATAGVGHVVAISSAMVNGASPDRAPIDDHAPRIVPTDDGGVASMVAFEEACDTVAGLPAAPALTVLRPAVLAGPRVDSLMTRHFEAPRILTVRGVRRDWQFVHLADLADAVALVVAAGLYGHLTVGALTDGKPDVLTPQEVADGADMRCIELPSATAFATAASLHKLGVLAAPASDLSYTVYPWTVTSRTLWEAGWSPRWTSRACLDVVIGQTRGRLETIGRRAASLDAAALGAAGAAVALLGTAAIWKQARGRS